MDVKYTRQIALPEIGEAGQEKLANASVLVVGAGGLGSPTLLYLTAMGIGHIGFIDNDRVGLSNLQRQIMYSAEDVGELKVEKTYTRLRALNPDVKLESISDRLTSANGEEIIKKYDVVVDACDNFVTRFLVDEISSKYGIPYVYASVGDFSGQVSVFNHSGCGSYRDFVGNFDRSEDELQVNVLGALPGIIGSIQAMEVIKIIVGCGETLSGKLLTIDTLANEYNVYSL
ncbi:HesA/MoeB/ThiF family protein [Porphyromonas sp.]|uniref:HesA/MoeB/ThiF family protein n=1 Tax=Porphyromonas sp. TaxID=1924944 RepID=UPI0026DA93EB|nr:HesA/MoeB/ThiF family protein [Porphyromonas sp.]MDO4695302.1 HesA/MoeB/ThiF family protein [Porphyromonas sp.]MDO4771035.1 HesA/MoeB/ThiF family protein [Porphyromonas sp.]